MVKYINISIHIFIATFYLFVPRTFAITEEQTDWSGGESSAISIPDVVTEWGNEFENSNDISWLAFPGELHLSSTPSINITSHFVGDYVYGNTYGVDIDDDGDTDIVGSSTGASSGNWEVVWWSNDDGNGTAWTKYYVDSYTTATRAIQPTDVDGDSDYDILGIGSSPNFYVVWWENVNGIGTSWTKHLIRDDYEGHGICGADIDNDGDTDVIAVGQATREVTYWENEDGIGTMWSEHTIEEQDSYGGVSVEDINSDGFIDIITASGYLNKTTWWENPGTSGDPWEEHTISNNYPVSSVYSVDIDSDDDIDVLSTLGSTDSIAWWENNDGLGTSWTKHTIAQDFDGATRAIAEDLDGDGDMDVLGAAYNDDDIAWWENPGNKTAKWTKYIIDGEYNAAAGVNTGDFDNDGAMDLVGFAAYEFVTWWEITDFKSEGYLTSDILDTEVNTGINDLYWGPIDWNSETPGNTTISIEVRASNNPFNMGNWEEIASPGDDLSDYIDDDTRYFQYKISLNTTDGDDSPKFEDVEIVWTVSNKSGAFNVPGAFALYPATPNPTTNGTASIGFALPYACEVELALYDLKGRKISVLAEGKHQPGEYEANITGLSNGVYIYRMRADDFTDTKKVVVK